MGTPGFAVPGLQALHESEIEVAAVITAPDRQSGRGRKVRFSTVKEYAVANEIPIMQPTNLKSEDFHQELAGFNADLFVVVAFRMLPAVVWQMPKLGTINLHASLLPNYRGAAPINWAIINGEKETGLTTFYINEKIDTGSIIYNAKTKIGPEENVGELHDRLMVLGSDLLLKTVRDIRDSNAPSKEQVFQSNYKEAPKLTKDNTRIDFNKDTNSILNLIRGLSPYPAAYSTLHRGEEKLNAKFYKASPVEKREGMTVGSVYNEGNKRLIVACSDGAIEIEELQIEGKKRMQIAQLLNGFSLDNKAFFG